MGGRQILNRQEEVHKRGRTNNTDVSISVILANAIIFIVIGTLREDPLSTGM